MRNKLPPRLNKKIPKEPHGCSKGAQGLSVQPQQPRIFTRNSISPSLRLRQRGSRYAIHAGRNLPVKEFRYLRTVRVTAAVYRSLYSVHKHLVFTQWHRAGVRPYTSCYHFAESCVFSKQSLPPCFLRPQLIGAPLIPKLLGKFAEFLKHSCLVRLNVLDKPTCVGLVRSSNF